jgi:hypothetical protein
MDGAKTAGREPATDRTWADPEPYELTVRDAAVLTLRQAGNGFIGRDA